MIKTDEYIVGRLKWKAKQQNLPSKYSSYYENLTNEKKEYYSEHLKVENIGIPTLIFTQPNNHKWTIITTRKIVWGENGQSQSLLFSNIKQIIPHSLASLEEVKNAVNDVLPKMEWNELTLVGENADKWEVYANKGPDFFAMWNILRMVWQLNPN